MTNVQIRDVPDHTVTLLKEAAEAHGQSLQRYLAGALDQLAGVAVNARILDGAGEDARDAGPLPIDPTTLVREQRDARGVDIDARTAG